MKNRGFISKNLENRLLFTIEFVEHPLNEVYQVPRLQLGSQRLNVKYRLEGCHL